MKYKKSAFIAGAKSRRKMGIFVASNDIMGMVAEANLQPASF
ncbi:MAG: hypothetical protein ACK5L7_09170 [Paludibacteraceae bacterium]